MTKKRLTKKERERQAALAERDRRVRLGLVAAVLSVVVFVIVLNVSVLDGVWPFGGDSPGRQAITDPDAPLASFYTQEVRYWRSEIMDWADAYAVNPNVIAIVIQIESCGDPVVISGAGAVGLMQVMPFHFGNGENMLNPDTNVRRGMSVFYECLTLFAQWDLGLALACYNGGPSVTQRDYSTWAAETQYYYRWATGLWQDVLAGEESSDTLAEWLSAGGRTLCTQASDDLF